jgi:hypothetical protein
VGIQVKTSSGAQHFLLGKKDESPALSTAKWLSASDSRPSSSVPTRPSARAVSSTALQPRRSWQIGQGGAALATGTPRS